ncbi:MAG: SCO6745 family protein [Segniliparus sp.]|uniref:SCO6745 family protein n=1 Tax=Segniliparus sp. TaxID=2804064 RepID=UPI003F3BF35B
MADISNSVELNSAELTAAQTARAMLPFDRIHASGYFLPEVAERFAAIGVTDPHTRYLASRVAPMGAVASEVVVATFYNFNPDMVVPRMALAWSLASPEEFWSTRLAGVGAGLRRAWGEELIASPEFLEAADLAEEAAKTLDAFDAPGRPLFAGHLRLQWPQEPHLRLWFGLTLLREHRGDGHVALLAGYGLTGLEASITYYATGAAPMPKEFVQASRGWSAEQWEASADGLRERGLLADGPEEALTGQGRAMRERIEALTDQISEAPWRRLGAERSARLALLLGPLRAKLFESGAIPAAPRRSR